MKVLVACEFSGTVRDAFRARGHDAYSCDILDAEPPSKYHIKKDVLYILNQEWDLIIGHPPCTWLCSSGLHWNKRGRNGLNPQECEAETDKALDFVCAMLNAPIGMKCIENPIGCITTRIKRSGGKWVRTDKGVYIPKKERVPHQIIQPNQFNEDASKATVLILDGLMPLRGTKDYPPRIVEWPQGSGKMVKRWSNQTDSGQNKLPPSADRWAERSLTYKGIAEAMAEQWG
jgi:hypothetical protein